MKGKIYRLSNGDKHYYGSTTKDLKTRLKNHISNIEDEIHGTSSSILFDSVVYNVSIDLMEEIEYENKDDLLWLERWWIENNECVNKVIPIRTNEEKYEIERQRHKRKYDENPALHIKKACAFKKQFRIDNPEYMKNKDKEQYEKHKAKKIQLAKEYYDKNKDEIKKQKSEKVKCECGCKTTKGSLNGHRKTKKHIKLMENKTENIKITITAEQQRRERVD
jgi:hypothetical protein